MSIIATSLYSKRGLHLTGRFSRDHYFHSFILIVTTMNTDDTCCAGHSKSLPKKNQGGLLVWEGLTEHAKSTSVVLFQTINRTMHQWQPTHCCYYRGQTERYGTRWDIITSNVNAITGITHFMPVHSLTLHQSSPPSLQCKLIPLTTCNRG